MLPAAAAGEGVAVGQDLAYLLGSVMIVIEEKSLAGWKEAERPSAAHILLLVIASQYVTVAYGAAAAAHLRCDRTGRPSSSSHGPVANARLIVSEMKTNTRNKVCESIRRSSPRFFVVFFFFYFARRGFGSRMRNSKVLKWEFSEWKRNIFLSRALSRQETLNAPFPG